MTNLWATSASLTTISTVGISLDCALAAPDSGHSPDTGASNGLYSISVGLPFAKCTVKEAGEEAKHCHQMRFALVLLTARVEVVNCWSPMSRAIWYQLASLEEGATAWAVGS